MLAVSRSGFYEWVERSTQPDPDALALEVAPRAAYARWRECYGPKRLRARLGLKCRHRRRFVRTDLLPS
jgi:hypothetical protein